MCTCMHLEGIVSTCVGYFIVPVLKAEAHQQACSSKFEKLSENGKQGQFVCSPSVSERSLVLVKSGSLLVSFIHRAAELQDPESGHLQKEPG